MCHVRMVGVRMLLCVCVCVCVCVWSELSIALRLTHMTCENLCPSAPPLSPLLSYGLSCP